tara:strand:- start:3600 stop:4040 length:441 start_codon:yes stop_codon:yes gene_type:complete
MAPANVIFRGPTERQPHTISLPVSGALKPGVFVEATATELVVLTTANGKNPRLLTNRDFYGQTVEDAYTDGDTGLGYKIEPTFDFLARVAAATYAINDPLTIGANGYLKAAAAGDVVVAHFTGVAGAKSAGDLVDVTIANSYVVQA